MEQVKDIPGVIPTLPPYPSDTIRKNLSLEEWNSCQDLWSFAIEFRLRLQDAHFSKLKLSQAASGIPFVLSYLQSYEQRLEVIPAGSKDAKLHHQCYFLLKRLLLATSVPYDSSAPVLFVLLGAGSVAFRAIGDWRKTLVQVWKRSENQVNTAIESCKLSLVKASSPDSDILSIGLHRLSALVNCLPETAVTIAAGTDFLEDLGERYSLFPPDFQRAATRTTYSCFYTFLSVENKHVSFLMDLLFEMNSQAERRHKSIHRQPTLLSSLICNTRFLRYFRSDPAVAATKRGQGLVDTLDEYRKTMAHLHPPPAIVDKRQIKGKRKAQPREEMHVHKASKVSEIHEIFPDLPSGYVLLLLDHFSDDTEAVIAALLEPSSLPPALRNPNSSADINISSINQPTNLEPRFTPPIEPQRKSIFDGDSFDRLQISSTKLHQGRREITDEPQSAEAHSRSKAAILAALAAFDADDDERDDTYDVADVGGTVDDTLDSDERRHETSPNKHEGLLFQAWKRNPEMFSRDSRTRLSKARQQLSQDTGMTNEQIEGWAIMIGRDEKLMRKLEQSYSGDRAFHGNQNVVEGTKWRGDREIHEDGTGDESDGRGPGRMSARGRSEWPSRGRVRGGGTAGPVDSPATQLARKRKEQGKGRGGASHNRRDGRARKMGRGMGPVQA